MSVLRSNADKATSAKQMLDVKLPRTNTDFVGVAASRLLRNPDIAQAPFGEMIKLLEVHIL